MTELPWGADGMAVWESDRARFFAGGNLFKHAPWIGRALAGDAVPDHLRPLAELGQLAAGEGGEVHFVAISVTTPVCVTKSPP